MPDITLSPFTRPFDRDFTPPGSKSISNRALVLAALSRGTCVLRNVLFADDTAVMLDSLRRLGFGLQIDEASKIVEIEGRSGEIPSSSAELFCGNSGTTIRFLTALCALGRGTFTLDGIERMRQRPVGPLVEMLRNLGARIDFLLNDSFPPIRVNANTLPGGQVRFDASSSSQFLSALLMSAPYTRHETHIHLGPNQTSWPYVQMTLKMMDDFGHTPELERDPNTGEPKRLIVPRGAYACDDYTVEPDASNASYFLALASLHPGSRLTLRGLSSRSLQGDAAYGKVLRSVGINVEEGRDFIRVTGPDAFDGFDVDLSSMPDLAQTTAVLALFARGRSRLSGLHTLRVKETDRIEALRIELTRLGAVVSVEGDDAIEITPPPRIVPASIDTYDDHRMAMSFALVGTRVDGITIRDAQCVNKTYPGYFHDLPG